MDIGTYTLDDDLIELAKRKRLPGMRVSRFDGIAVLLGRGSDPEVELHVEACEEDGVRMLRRHGGGCAVVLDPGMVIVGLVLPSEGLGGIREYFERISKWLIDGLGGSGVEGVRREGISDLVMGDRKIAGASMQRKRDFVYYTASILVKPDIELMERYLKHPPREPAYRRKRTHRDFVGMLGQTAHVGEVDAFRDRLTGALPPLERLISGGRVL